MTLTEVHTRWNESRAKPGICVDGRKHQKKTQQSLWSSHPSSQGPCESLSFLREFLYNTMAHDPLSLLLSLWCPHQREASDWALGSVGIMNIYWILTRNQPLPYISHISFNFRTFPWSTFYPHSRLQIRNLRLGGIKWIDQGATVGGSGVVTRAVSWQRPHSKPRVGKLWLVGQIWPTAYFYK